MAPSAVPAPTSDSATSTEAHERSRARLELIQRLDKQDLTRTVEAFSDLDLHCLRHAVSSGDFLEVGRIFACALNGILSADARVFALRQKSLTGGAA